MKMHFKKHINPLINVVDYIWAPPPLSLFHCYSALYSFQECIIKEVSFHGLEFIFEAKVRNLFMKEAHSKLYYKDTSVLHLIRTCGCHLNL